MTCLDKICFALTELVMGRSWSYCCCSGVNSTRMLFGMSISMSLAGAKASSITGCPLPGFPGHGISPSLLSIRDNTVLSLALNQLNAQILVL